MFRFFLRCFSFAFFWSFVKVFGLELAGLLVFYFLVVGVFFLCVDRHDFVVGFC